MKRSEGLTTRKSIPHVLHRTCVGFLEVPVDLFGGCALPLRWVVDLLKPFVHLVSVVEVEVDSITGWVAVPRVWIAHDIGRALNPVLVRGQVEGSVYMGLGEALMEEQAFRRLPAKLSGALVHKFPSMLEYKSPTSLDMPEIDIYGSHTGASIAMELAIAQPKRVRRLVLDGIGLYTPEELADILAHYAPAIEPDQIGSQLTWAWHFVRDQALFFPWFKRDAGHARTGGLPPAEVLHATVVEVLKSIRTYHLAYRAAFRHPKRERLPLVTVPALVLGDSSDPLFPAQEEVCSLLPDGRMGFISNEAGDSESGDDVWARKARAIERFLAG